jgi:hypothetical protein
MPTPCSVCLRPDRVAIDTLLASGSTYRAASRSTNVPKDTLARHHRKCLGAGQSEFAKRMSENARKRAARNVKYVTNLDPAAPLDRPEEVLAEFKARYRHEIELEAIYTKANLTKEAQAARKEANLILRNVAEIMGLLAKGSPTHAKPEPKQRGTLKLYDVQFADAEEAAAQRGEYADE